MKKNALFPLSLLVLLALFSVFTLSAAEASPKYDSTLKRWSKFEEYRDKFGGTFRIRATLQMPEYIEALMQSEAEKNLWTASELEDYKYNYLKTVRLDDYIAIYLEMEELGPTAHMAPFNEMVYMWIGKKKYSAVDYDQRFNLPLQGKRDGYVFFPKRDEKTGESLLKKNIAIRFVMIPGASPILDTREVRFIWDIKGEDALSMSGGTAADRLELDRLLRRLDKISKEKSDIESQLSSKNREIDDVKARIEELQKK